MTPVAFRHQCDRNAGRAGGLLVSILHQPDGRAGNWELSSSAWLPEPDGVRRSNVWVPRSERLTPAGGSPWPA